jgi:hypothetical protein
MILWIFLSNFEKSVQQKCKFSDLKAEIKWVLWCNYNHSNQCQYMCSFNIFMSFPSKLQHMNHIDSKCTTINGSPTAWFLGGVILNNINCSKDCTKLHFIFNMNYKLPYMESKLSPPYPPTFLNFVIKCIKCF